MTSTPVVTAPTPEGLVLAKRLVSAIQLESMLDRYATRAASTDSDVVKRYRAFISKYLDMGAIRDRIAEEYARRFNVDELREMVRFFESPAGRKYTELQPALVEPIQPMVATVFREHFEEYKHEILGLP